MKWFNAKAALPTALPWALVLWACALAGALSFGGCCHGGGRASRTVEPSGAHESPGAVGAKTVPGGTFGGMKAYVDPESGELTDTPPPGADPLPGDVHVPAGTARPSPVPGGGLMLEDEPKGRD